ncbi:MAG: hypothetical protein ACU0BN_12210 [Sulfitobacter sp.]
MTNAETKYMKHASRPISDTSDHQKRAPKKTNATWPALRLELHDLIINGLTNRQLAANFAVSERTVIDWKKTLARELVANENLDSFTWISEQIATLKLLRAEVMQNYDLAKERGATSQAQKWLSLALKAEIGLNNLLISSGALDDTPLSPAKLKKRAQHKTREKG